MAATPTLPLVPVDEYLNSTYEHDVEYVDGVLVERGMPTIPHSLLQSLLLVWFARHEKQGHYKVLAECRTQIIERARYRIPDIMLCPRPLPSGRICDAVPLAVIEIVSPDDTLAETRHRLRDYGSIGVDHLVLMDPEELVAYKFENGSLLQTQFDGLPLASGFTVPFHSNELFMQLKAEHSLE